MLQALTQKPAIPATAFPPLTHAVLQRKCNCGGAPGFSGECEECRKKQQGTLQRAALNSGLSGSSAPPIVQDVLRSPGRPLDTALRAYMEPRFSHDFSQVRVHTDSQAARSTQTVNALAYTVGQHIVFDANQYRPDTQPGRRLVAHELTHVMQQSKARQTPGHAPAITGNDNAEREAERISMTIEQGAVGSPTQFQQSPVLQRQLRIPAHVIPRPCEKWGNCPPPRPAPMSPIPNCSTLLHETVMLELAREYVRTELDPSLSLNVRSLDCFANIGPCTIEFDSGVAVEASLLLLDPSMSPTGAEGRVFVEEIVPPSVQDPLKYSLKKSFGPKCSYDVDCSQGKVKWTLIDCRQRGPLGPGDFPTPSGEERVA